MTGSEVFWKLANGQVYEVPFTVREGETMFDIARELEAGKFMRAGDFLYAAGDPALIRDFAPGARTLEGFLFPATYELPRHPAASELTVEMVHKFKEQWKHIASAPAGGATEEGNHRDANRAASDTDGLSLFRGQHAGRAFLWCDAGGTQQKCGEVPSDAGRAAGGSASTTAASAPLQPQEKARQATAKQRQSAMTEDLKTKKALILETAREIKVQQWTPAEIDQLRRRLVAEHGEAGKTGMEYIADVLKDAGQKVTINQQEEAEEQYEEEFEDLLHFKTLEDAKINIMRLD